MYGICADIPLHLCRHGDRKPSDCDPISQRWVLLHGDFKWICHHFPAEYCGDRTISLCRWCFCVCFYMYAYMCVSVWLPLRIFLKYVGVCMSCSFSGGRQWRCVAPEELDNVSSKSLSQPSLCNQYTLGSSPNVCQKMIQQQLLSLFLLK